MYIYSISVFTKVAPCVFLLLCLVVVCVLTISFFSPFFLLLSFSLSNSIQVNEMGMAAEMSASEERWENKFAQYAKNFEESLKSEIETAKSEKEQEMQAAFAIRFRLLPSLVSYFTFFFLFFA